MKKSAFLQEYGPEWKKFARKPMFAALLSMLDDESPSREITTKGENDRLHGGAVFTNEIFGWEKMRKLIAELADSPMETKEIPDTYEHAETI